MNINLLIFLLLPTYLIHFHVNEFISFNLLELLILVGLINNLILIFERISFVNFLKIVYQNKKLFLPVSLILLGFLFSYLYNQHLTAWSNWSDGLGKLLDLLILPIFYSLTVYFLTLSDVKKTLPSISIIFKKVPAIIPLNFLMSLSYFFSSMIVSLVGLIFWLTNLLTFDQRLSIFFPSPNDLAIFLAPAFIIIASFIVSQFNFAFTTSFKKYKLLYFASVFFLADLFLTKSLGAIMAMAIVALFVLSNYGVPETNLSKRFFLFIKKKSSVLVATLLIIGTVSILNLNILLKKIDYTPSSPPSSIDSRLVVYQVGAKILSTHWLIGIGINNFQTSYLALQKNFPPYPQWAIPHSHNNLMHFWLEGGLLAVIGLVLLYKNILFISDKKKQAMFKLTIAQMILFYFILHGMVDVTIWTPASAMIFWFTAIYFLGNYQIKFNSGDNL